MKRFNIVALVAGLMVTGCALGMDTIKVSQKSGAALDASTINKMEIRDIKNTLLNVLAKADQKKLTNNYRDRSTICGKLEVLNDWLQNKKCTIDQITKEMLAARINDLQALPKTPTKSVGPDVPSPASQVKDDSVKLVADPKPVAKKVFSAKGLLLHPVFIGVVGISTLAALTYTYFKKKETKKVDNIDTDLDEDTLSL